MSSIKLQLPNKCNLSVEEYVEQKLVPLAGELKRLCEEFMIPGSTAEDSSTDFSVKSENLKIWQPLDRRMSEDPKSCEFFIPPEFPMVKGDKRMKVCLLAVLYVQGQSGAAFRLVRSSDGEEIEGSLIQTLEREPTLFQRYLPIGRDKNTIWPDLNKYHIEARSVGGKNWPVCRRFSLSCVYV